MLKALFLFLAVVVCSGVAHGSNGPEVHRFVNQFLKAASFVDNFMINDDEYAHEKMLATEILALGDPPEKDLIQAFRILNKMKEQKSGTSPIFEPGNLNKLYVTATLYLLLYYVRPGYPEALPLEGPLRPLSEVHPKDPNWPWFISSGGKWQVRPFELDGNGLADTDLVRLLERYRQLKLKRRKIWP